MCFGPLGQSMRSRSRRLRAQDLPLISAQKYNAWCEKRILVCADQDRLHRALGWEVRKDLSPSESAACFLHELTGCEGLEFVAFSNARLPHPVTLGNGVVLVPWFLTEIGGQNIQEPLTQATMRLRYLIATLYLKIAICKIYRRLLGS